MFFALVRKFFEYQLPFFMASSLRRNPFIGIPLGGFYWSGDLFKLNTQIMLTRKPSDPTIKRLFADSKGICAECNKGLFPDGINIAVICHIEAFSSGGSRFNKALKIAGKENQYENLIVLCSICHIKIDTKGKE
jgi:hypothetical protein